jgi:hypothetical protein
LEGGANTGNSGRIRAFGKLASVSLGGDLIGGGGFYLDVAEGISVGGQIASGGPMGSVVINGNVIGGAGANSAQINGESIAKVVIEGDVTQGLAEKTASVIASRGNLTSLTVKGTVTLVENITNEEGYRLQFSANGSIGSASFGALSGTGGFSTGLITAVNSIGKLTVENSAKYFEVLAGYNPDHEQINSKATINKVIIGTTGDGNLQGVDIVAGVTAGSLTGVSDGYFGTADDSPITPFSSKSVSRIASVVIKGNVLLSPSQTDHYGIVAGQIDFVKINGVALKLTPRIDVIEVNPPPGPIVIGPQPGDFTVREVSFVETPL